MFVKKWEPMIYKLENILDGQVLEVGARDFDEALFMLGAMLRRSLHAANDGDIVSYHLHECMPGEPYRRMTTAICMSV